VLPVGTVHVRVMEVAELRLDADRLGGVASVAILPSTIAL
jgi:hypothetical protein